MTTREILADVQNDRSDAPCAACGRRETARRNENPTLLRRPLKAGVTGQLDRLVMLCVDAAGCCKRYRRGLQPAGYAALVKRGEMP